MTEAAENAVAPSPERGFTLRERLVLRIASALAYGVLRLLSLTWRIESDMTLYEEVRRAGETVVGVLWHGRILAFTRPWSGKNVCVIISRHRDGELIARVLARFGHVAVRGSSTRGGAAALKGLVEAANDRDVAVTPDGPRGPRYSAAPGFVEIAALTGRPVLLGAWSADRAWELGTWDRFLIPKPFARIRFRYEVNRVPEGLGDDGKERCRAELQARLKRLTADLDREMGRAVDPALAETTAETAARRARELAAASAAPRPAAARGAERRRRRARAAAVVLLSALLLAAAPALLRGGDVPPNARADLCATLLLAAGAAAAAAAPLAAAGRGAALAAGLAGALLAALAAALPAGTALLGAALAGWLQPALLALAGAALARTTGSVLLGAAGPLLLLGSLFLAGPLLTLLPHGSGDALYTVLHLSPITAISGSLLGIDLLRTAPLYGLLPVASETAFAYPEYWRTLLAPALLALASPLLPKASRAPGESYANLR